MNDKDKEILSFVQDSFPLVKRPFMELGKNFCMEEKEFIKKMRLFFEKGVIKRIGTKIFWNGKRALVALRVKKNLNKAIEYINKFDEVSHNYLRTGYYNIWFTISGKNTEEIEKKIEDISSALDCKLLIFPTKNVFKIDTNFLKGKKESEVLISNLSYDEIDRKILHALQDGIEIKRSPYKKIAKIVGIDEDELLLRMNSLVKRGVKFRAFLSPKKIGLKASALVAWKAAKNRIEDVGKKIAKFDEVSHCYERGTPRNWRYNMFAVLHAYKRKELDDIIKRISKKCEIEEKKVLYTIKELKKTAPKVYI
ncbi:MAG: AsnC family transcriptional regulator [Candidatus Thermoplasmatota archaeon]